MGNGTGLPSAQTASTQRRFWAVLGVIVVVALGLRIVYVATVARHDDAFYDAAYYHLQANANADGHWFENPFPFVEPEPAAEHPPLTALAFTPVAFAISDLDDNLLGMRYTTAVLGAVVVGLIGLLGREVVGRRVGWTAAGIAAVYPYLWVNDGLVMSETFAAGLTVGAMLLAYRLRRHRSLAIAAGLGVVCGLAALTRSELLLLVPFLVILTPLLRRDDAWPARLRTAGVGVLAAVLVISPWIVFNATRFDKPVLLSTNDGAAMAGASCDRVFYGPQTGLWQLSCVLPAPKGDQSVQSATYRSRAVRYVRDNLSRYPVVLLARTGRMWSLYRPFDMIDGGRGEGRPSWVTALGLAFYYPLLLLAIAGAFLLRGRRIAWWVLAMPILIVLLDVIPAYGQTRLRLPAEPSLVVLGSVALVAIFERVTRHQPVPSPATPSRAPLPVGSR